MLKRTGKKSTKSSHQYWQKFLSFHEPAGHIAAKKIIINLALKEQYTDIEEEWRTTFPVLCLGRFVRFPLDLYLHNRTTAHKVLVNLDGDIHNATAAKIAKTKNRDKILSQYAKTNGYEYVVLDVDDVINNSSLPSLQEFFNRRINSSEKT